MTDELLGRQIEMESRARQRGIDRFNSQLAGAYEGLRGEDTSAGLFLIKKSVEPVAKGIEAFVADAYSGKPGVKAIAAVILKDLDPYMSAFCAMQVIMGGLGVLRARSLSSISSAIARKIETELKMAAFEGQKPGLYATIFGRLKDRGATPAHIERVASHTVAKYGIDWSGWTPAQRNHLGAALINVVAETTGYCIIKAVKTGKNQITSTVQPTEALAAWVKDRNANASILQPVLMPMIVPPRRWEGLRGGGYKSSAILRVPLVKRMTKGHREAMAGRDLTSVHAGINAIQDTPWQINTRVLDVATFLWDAGLPMPGLPNRDEEIVPAAPADADVNPEALKAWKAVARTIHENNIAGRSKRVATRSTIEAATELRREAALHFPSQLDFRGRVYSRVVALNPQGTDFSKGLLTFAVGKPLENERAVGWLAIHGANCFGVDKVSHEARIDWVYDNAARILSVAADPHADIWWYEADSPWGFLAFCFEWARFSEEGLGFVSSLPIAMDGSCNGIQHYSAMLRDPVGGAAVNLTPSAAPQDIYGRVAEEVIRKLKAIAGDNDHEKAWVAQTWLAFGIDRKTTKRQVMVLPYGGTQSSCREYTLQAAREKIAGGVENPFGDELATHAMWLGGIIWSSIGDVVVAARSAMQWLRDVAKVVTAAGVPLVWTTPSGFVAHQDYRETKQRRVKLRVGEQLVYITHNEETMKLDKTRQSSGIAPNFVHSMDAAAMILTIEMALHNGVTHFAMIHDSYGTLAADTDKLAACLREAFIGMYSDSDVLATFRDEVSAQLPPALREKLPPVPEKGTLDLSLIRDSAFFFT